MPIRMTDDEPEHEDPSPGGRRSGGRSRGGGGGSGGGGRGGIGALLSLILFIFRHPKLSLVLLVLGGLFVFFSDGKSASTGDLSADALGTGATLDQEVYDEVLVHEPLAEARPGTTGLPERMSLLAYAPPRGSQGSQGSCVGWATSYAARTIVHARQTGQPPASVVFSPSYLYNQIALEDCRGTYLSEALEVLQNKGDLPLSDFAYDDQSCGRVPNGEEKKRATAFRIAGYDRLSVDSDDYRVNTLALKQHLAQSAPIVIGMRVGGTFMSAMGGRRVWLPTEADRGEVEAWGGHAMAVIGYDDLLEGGAFQLMNSWGTGWGEDGVAWVRYRDFDHFVKEAYGIYPMGEPGRGDREQVISFGLVETGSLKRIALRQQGGATFRTASPIKRGTRFKVEFANTKPTYTYLFGQETDGSSYVLFPYTDKHSPYCGTTGTRLFPRKQSLTADATGTRDSVAVVISPRPLDVHELNTKITAGSGASYGEKLQAALGDRITRQVKRRIRGDLVELTSSGADDDHVQVLVLEFDKI